MSSKRCHSAVAVMGVVLAALLGSSARAEPTLSFPIVVETKAELERLGFSLVKPDEQPAANPWREKACVDRSGVPQGLLVAVADEVVARYAKRGFTRRTLCLALAGAPLYDPYSGQRLPSFVYRDPVGVSAVLIGRDPAIVDSTELITAGVMTDEIPLAVPQCFRNGKPHIDCEWRYSERTGRQRTQGTIRSFAKAGERLESAMDLAIANAAPEAKAQNNGSVPVGFARSEHFVGTPKTFKLPVETLRSLIGGQPLAFSWFEFGPDLPNGYGYTVDPRGNDKRPTLSAAATEERLSGKKRISEIDADKLNDSLSSTE
jgi:hypothetical protein